MVNQIYSFPAVTQIRERCHWYFSSSEKDGSIHSPTEAHQLDDSKNIMVAFVQ